MADPLPRSPLRVTWVALGAILLLQVGIVAMTPASPRARDMAWTPEATGLLIVALATAGGTRLLEHDGAAWLAGSMCATLLGLRQSVHGFHVDVPPPSEVLLFYAIAGLLLLGAAPAIWRQGSG